MNIVVIGTLRSDEVRGKEAFYRDRSLAVAARIDQRIGYCTRSAAGLSSGAGKCEAW